MKSFRQYLLDSTLDQLSKKRKVDGVPINLKPLPITWVDAEGKTVYIKGVPVSKRGGLSHIEWLEAKDMKTGTVTTNNNGVTYYAPFTQKH